MGHAVADDVEAVTGGHGQAALLLVESLIHGLIEQGTLSVSQALDIVDTASSVSLEIDRGLIVSAVGQKSIDLLNAIAQSLMVDQMRPSPNPEAD